MDDPKLKFLMITTFFPPYNFGGDGIYIYRLVNELAKRGHKVDVVHNVDAYKVLEKTGPKGNYPNHENITVHFLENRYGYLLSLYTQQTTHSIFKKRKIDQLISENNYDVIHYHNMSLIGLDVLALGSAIKLYHMHEHWLVCPMHVLWKYNREACTKRNCISCQIAGKRPVQLWRYLGIMDDKLAHIDAFLSPSIFTKNKHHELGFNKPIIHLPYFLPSSENHNSEKTPLNKNGKKRPFFLFVGRLEKIKGLQNVIPIFAKYDKSDLLIAGDGEYDAELKKLAANVPNVKFLGRLSYRELQALYHDALAVIVPSICYEVFGIIIIESFAHKTPVIVNNLGALPEVVTQSQGGFIYNTEDELIDQMEQLRLNPSLKTELGNNGYNAYQKYWTEEYHINKYYQVIREVAERKHINHPVIDALNRELAEQG